MNRRLRLLASAAVASLVLACASPAFAAPPPADAAEEDLGNPEKAIKKFQQAVEKAPDDSQSWYNLALANYRAKKYDDAATACAKAAELNPASSQTQQLLGGIAAKRGKASDAIAAFTKARELETAGGATATAETLLGLGSAYNDAERWDDSIEAYKAAYKVVKDSGKGDIGAINNQLGVAYLKKGDTEQAIKWFEKNIELAPDKAVTYYNLAQMYRKLAAKGTAGMWAKSAEMFVRAADMDKADVYFQFFAGEALLFAGRKAEAVTYLDRYLAGDPAGKKAIAKFGPAGKTEMFEAASQLKAEALK